MKLISLTTKLRDVGLLKMIAGIMASEVIESGKSDGWQGGLEDLAQIKNILSKFNICYVDDFVRKWAYRQR